MGKGYVEVAAFDAGTHEGTRVVDGVLVLDPDALLAGEDGQGRYNSGAFLHGRYTTEEQPAAFTEAIESWQSNVPLGTWLEVELRAQVDGAWTKWYSMGVWLEQNEPFQRHSVDGQGDEAGTVLTDAFVVKQGTAAAVQARITLFTTDAAATPAVRALGVAFSTKKGEPGAVPFSGVTSDIPVPKRSQMVFPNGGNVWCSPTSVTMVMAYWAEVTGDRKLDVAVPAAKDAVWDYAYDGAGNWVFNTAYASSFGLQAKVMRLHHLAEAERWTAAGVPVIASIRYKEGELDGSPLPKVPGHLVVVRGFDGAGNVIVNDPAFPSDDEVLVTYDRLQFERCWLNNSGGAVYLIYPNGWNVPE